MKNLIGLCRAMYLGAGLLLLSGALQMAFAQSLRAPTPAEKAALTKVHAALKQIVDSFAHGDWEIADNNFDPALNVSTQSDAHSGIGYSVRIEVRPGTPLYKRIMAPQMQLMQQMQEHAATAQSAQQMMQEQQRLEAAADKASKQSTIRMDIEVNGGFLGLGSSPQHNKPLQVHGASKAFVVAQDNNTTRRTGACVLAFGDWQDAKYDAENQRYVFKFKHPPQTAWVEEVVIEIYGANSRIEQLLQQADWNSVNAALTK